MPSFANITLLGHLGRDPEVKQLPSGNTVTNISLATSRKRQDGEITTWWRGAVWGARGEAMARFLKKGDPVLIVGEPYAREWTDQQGASRVSMEVDVRDWSFASSRSEAAQGGFASPPEQRAAVTHQTAQPPAQPPTGNGFDPRDDIPF